MNIETNSKPKKYQFAIFSKLSRANFINLSANKIPQSFKNDEQKKKISWIENKIKNISKAEFDINADKNEKTKSNLNSTGFNYKSSLLKNYKKHQTHLDSSRNIKNSSIKKKLVNNTINTYSINNIDDKNKNKEYLFHYNKTDGNYNYNYISKKNYISNNNEMRKKCRHKEVKKEINPNINKNYIKLDYNKIKSIRNSNTKLIDSSHANPNENKSTKSSTILINKKIKDNIVNFSKKDKPLLNYIFFKKKLNKRAIKIHINENSKENIEINKNNNKNLYNFKNNTINSKLGRIKSLQNNIMNKKNLSLRKYIKGIKIFKNTFYKINSKENKIKENSDIYFDENELNENILSKTTEKFNEYNIRNQIINKVHYFRTECNEIFNEIKNESVEDNIVDLNQTYNEKNINEKKVSYSTIILNTKKENNNQDKVINTKENESIQKIKNIIKNNLDYKMNKNKNILRKIPDNWYNKIPKFNSDSILGNAFNKYSNKKNKGNENLKINQDYISSEKNNETNSLLINKGFKNMRQKFNGINLSITTKHLKSLIHRKNAFYGILKLENFIKIFFSLCEIDNDLTTKFSLISKEIYKKIRPLIYQKISKIIFKYNGNKVDRNKIKIYFMKNNSSLIKLSPAILHKKYTDLIFENNNQYDIEIKKDLTRTFPDDILFKYGNVNYNKLYHILTAYSNYNKNIGYIQGLNFISAQIIYFFEDEIDEFIFLDAIINKLELEQIFLNNQFLKKILEKINVLLLKNLPKINKFLSDINLNFDYFITSWILSLFSSSMETEYLSIIWDYIIIFGWKFVKYFILNILISCENDILNSTLDNLASIKKNIFKNEIFKKNFNSLIDDSVQSMIKDDEFI